MRVIRARNVHQALPQALALLEKIGEKRPSRNGEVLVSPEPVATVYERPEERVVFWPERDANPFFHLYEALWMLAGRNDIAGPARYARQMLQYSDDGVTQHGAYGYRWRNADESNGSLDQLWRIESQLMLNRDDRRCVLQMWDAGLDLGRIGKDVPCNLTATLQVSIEGKLDFVVFCRSNDIVWGCYGANAVHFSMLQEYVARRIGVEVGTYTQVSVNWHAYLNPQLFDLQVALPPRRFETNPYNIVRLEENPVRHVPMPDDISPQYIVNLVRSIDDLYNWISLPHTTGGDWTDMVFCVFKAHWYHKNREPMAALEALAECRTQNADWVVAAREWLQRRQK